MGTDIYIDGFAVPATHAFDHCDCQKCAEFRRFNSMKQVWISQERERCAKIAEDHPYSPAQMNDGARDEIAAAIRGR